MRLISGVRDCIECSATCGLVAQVLESQPAKRRRWVADSCDVHAANMNCFPRKMWEIRKAGSERVGWHKRHAEVSLTWGSLHSGAGLVPVRQVCFLLSARERTESRGIGRRLSFVELRDSFETLLSTTPNILSLHFHTCCHRSALHSLPRRPRECFIAPATQRVSRQNAHGKPRWCKAISMASVPGRSRRAWCEM